MPNSPEDSSNSKVIRLVPPLPDEPKDGDEFMQVELEADMDALEALLVPLRLLAGRAAAAIQEIGNNKEKERCQAFLKKLDLVAESFDDLWQAMVVDKME